MSAINPEFIVQVAKIKAALGSLDYFQLLRVSYDAGTDQIRAGYHKQSRAFHPDRYHHLNEPELVEDLTTISKRITEAYVVLRDTEKRQRYLGYVQGPDRALNLRYIELHEEEERADVVARTGKTPQGRKLYHEAVEAFEAGDQVKAVNCLKMALLYEKDNPTFIELLARWQGEVP